MLLSGCASYDDPYFVHSVYRPVGAVDVNADVFFVTDRAKTVTVPPGFGFVPGEAPSCGVVHAVVPPARLPGGAAIFAREAGRDALTCGPGQMQIAAAIARAAHDKNCDSVLLFVHGFDTGFETAVLRAGQLGIDTQWRCAVAAFSWSSSGDRTEYDEDTTRATAAEPLFGDLLHALSDAGITADIVAHSMGTRLVLGTLGQNGARADQVILTAADIGIAQDDDQFPTLAHAAAPHLNRLTVYASRNDAVLAISKRFNNGVPRLGREPLAAYRAAAPKVDVIDASAVPGDYTGHNYYGLSYEIIADMALALDGVPAEARLQPRLTAPPTLLPGEDGLPYRLNVADNRAPDLPTRLLRWLISLFTD